MDRKTWAVYWLIAAVLLFFANGSLLITDTVESNYALTAKEMLLSGDWVSPQIYGSYWYDKPVMFYWLTAAAFKIFGITEFAARFFPAVFGLAGLWLVIYGGKRLYGERAGFFSGVILLSTIEFFLISKSVITDAVLFFFFSGSLLFFYLGYKEDRSRDWYLMYACAALATLTKGPVGFLLPGLIITLFLLYKRDWRVLGRCRFFSGLLLFLALSVPWYAVMYHLHGSDFLMTFFGVHNFLRATVSEHPRDNVFYYYTLVNILALFPWSALLPLALYRRWRAKELHFSQDEIFLLLWAAVIFFFFQNMATKYITYTYPLLFPLAIWLGSELNKNPAMVKNKFNLGFIVTVFCLLLIAAAWLQLSGRGSVEQGYFIGMALIAGFYLYLKFKEQYHAPIYGIGICAVVFYLALIHTIAVPLSQQRSARDLGLSLQRFAADTQEIGIYGNYPASAVFYSGKKLVKIIPKSEFDSFRPEALSWKSKNVMPFNALENKKYQVVAVNKCRLDDFGNNLAAPCYQPFEETNGWLLLRLK